MERLSAAEADGLKTPPWCGGEWSSGLKPGWPGGGYREAKGLNHCLFGPSAKYKYVNWLKRGEIL